MALRLAYKNAAAAAEATKAANSSRASHSAAGISVARQFGWSCSHSLVRAAKSLARPKRRTGWLTNIAATILRLQCHRSFLFLCLSESSASASPLPPDRIHELGRLAA